MARNPAAFSVNDRVLHSVFGVGTITAMNSLYTTVAFDEGGARKFVATMVRLEHSDAPAPSRPARSRKTKAAK